MMCKQQKPIMFAYIIFLCFCAVHYWLSTIYEFEFENWERIIAAVTISSYFFSSNSLTKTKIVAKKEVLRESEERRELLNKQMKVLLKLSDSKNETSHAECFLNKNNDFILKIEKQIEREENIVFIIDVIGFFMFFCILTFNEVYYLFEPYQGICTLLAFIIVLLVEGVEPIAIANIKNACVALNDCITKELDELEKKISDI